MKRLFIPLLIVVFVLAVAAPATARVVAYQTEFDQWRGAESQFAAWSLTGASIAAGGGLVLDPASAQNETDPYPAGGYYGGDFYNGGLYLVGEAQSQEVTVSGTVRQVVASWNASTPAGTWIETQIQAKLGDRWTKWYNLGVWASDDSTIQRHSVPLQGDADAYVAVDTLVVVNTKAQVGSLKLKVRLFQALGATAAPSLQSASLASSSALPKKAELVAGDSAHWGTLLAVPESSSMVYPDGGPQWASPTCMAMVLGFWAGDTGPSESRVRAAVAGVYDRVYDGHGNWPFNTAYAGAQGLEASVRRFSSMRSVESWVKAGVPVIISFGWKKGELTGAPSVSSSGHLVVVVGFDASGNPIVNDPGAATDADAQRTYLRSELERLWLTSTGGTAYVIYPTGTVVPTEP